MRELQLAASRHSEKTQEHTGNGSLVQKYTELAEHFGPIRLRSVFASPASVCECERSQVFVCLWLTQYLDGSRNRLTQTWGVGGASTILLNTFIVSFTAMKHFQTSRVLVPTRHL